MGRVAHTPGDGAVAQSAADDHTGVALLVYAGGVFGEEPLMGCDEPTDFGQTQLTAVGMSAQAQVNACRFS